MTTRTKTRTIPIQPSKSYLRWAASERLDFGAMAWLKSPPFAVNPRGVLVHRVRHVTTHLRNGVESHHSMHYLCGNGTTFSVGSEDDVLVSDPPADRLLCEHCEAVARRQELPSGDALAGRHVHRGVLVPKKVCCNHNRPETQG